MATLTDPTGGSRDLRPPVLRVRGLDVRFTPAGRPPVVAATGVDLDVHAGELVALLGESGSGKTVTARAVMGIQDPAATVTARELTLSGLDLLGMDEAARRQVRGERISMVLQDALSSLNPVLTIGDQIGEVFRVHRGLSRRQARARAVELLDLVGIARPGERVDSYPHQFSGGMRQRILIAMAIALEPELLIADEPTTALDVTVQVQILALLNELQREENMAVLMITHDLNLVRHFADRVGVMERGVLIETASTAELFAAPKQPYTRALLGSRPQRMTNKVDGNAAPLLAAQQVRCVFDIQRGWFRKTAFVAVDNADLTVAPGETLGIVGESGSGKSTLGLSLLRLSQARVEGSVRFGSAQINQLPSRALRPLRAKMQIVFQDPFASLSPRRTVEQIVGEGLALHQPGSDRNELRSLVAIALAEVGLPAETMSRYPHEFSGGQRQRIAIARALVLKPELIVLDEPTSSLDVSVQQQVLQLLADLQRKYRIAYIFISHDLAVIRAMAHRVMVMKDGKVVESGPTEAVMSSPAQPYTQRLLAAAEYATVKQS